MSTPIYMSLTDVAARVSLSEATVQKMVRENAFPKPRPAPPARPTSPTTATP